jgi:hypothetical protein
MSEEFNPLKKQIESDLEHFRKSYNLPKRHVYKYEDGSGVQGYIVTNKPITFGSHRALNVKVYGFGGRGEE